MSAFRFVLHIAALIVWTMFIYKASSSFGNIVFTKQMGSVAPQYVLLIGTATTMVLAIYFLWNFSNPKRRVQFPLGLVSFFISGILLRLFYLVQEKPCDQNVLALFFVFSALVFLMTFIKAMIYYKCKNSIHDVLL